MQDICLSEFQICLLLRESLAALPMEACGIIAGQTGCATRIFTAVNVAQTLHRFSIAPDELSHILCQIDRAGDQWLGIWHSHPQSPAVPSAADIRCARHPTKIWLIVSLATGGRVSIGKGIRYEDCVIRGYRIDGERCRFHEVPVRKV